MKEELEGKVNIVGHRLEIMQMLVQHAYAQHVKITSENAQVSCMYVIKLFLIYGQLRLRAKNDLVQ